MPIDQVALWFCHDILGWKAPVLFAAYHKVVLYGKHRKQEGALCYVDPNAVGAAVRSWCKQHDLSLSTNYVSGWNVLITRNSSGHHLAEVTYDNQCEALLRACLEANHKREL